MRYPKQLLRLRPTKGIVSDTPSHEVGPEFYTAGQNVIFREGFASRIRGYRSAYDTALYSSGLTDILHALNVRLGGTNYWLVFDDETAFAIESTNATEITVSGGMTTATQPAQFSSTLLNGIPVVSNG